VRTIDRRRGLRNLNVSMACIAKLKGWVSGMSGAVVPQDGCSLMARLSSRHCDSSQAIHLAPRGAMDCFATLAMTGKYSRVLATCFCTRFASSFACSKIEGAGKMAARCTRGLTTVIYPAGNHIRNPASPVRHQARSVPSLLDSFLTTSAGHIKLFLLCSSTSGRLFQFTFRSF